MTVYRDCRDKIRINTMEILVIIPCYNPDEKFYITLRELDNQVSRFHLLIIDSGENKSYQQYLKAFIRHKVSVVDIAVSDFNHGGTRQWGMSLCPHADVYVFLTQDAILANEFSIANLLSPFYDDKVGAVYGRQLPHKDASIFARTAREINYGEESHVYTYADRAKHGMKTCFMSNSFAAYRRTAMENVRGFPMNTILSEDMYVAAKMLMKGWKIGYVADAWVYHSHNYTIKQEFKRYFDIGVFHSREKWIRNTFGAAEGEGKKYVLYETSRILQTSPWLLMAMFFRDVAKICGYRLGLVEKKLPTKLKKKISMNARYWDCDNKN